MISKYFRRRSEKQAEQKRAYRTLLAGTLMRKLNQNGELTLDRELQTELGAPNHELRHTAYELALQEQIHIMAENDGVIRIVSNRRFEQITREYASTFTTTRTTEAPRTQNPDAWEESTIEPLSVTDPDADAIYLDQSDFLEPITKANAKEPYWQNSGIQNETQTNPADWVENAGVACENGKESRETTSDSRKTLPPREREPWFGFNAIKFPRIHSKKKDK